MAEQNASINGSTGGNDPSWWTPEQREFVQLAQSLFVWMISTIEIPVMILTLFALCVLVKSHRSAPVFVIHLIFSDLIQIISKLMMTFEQRPGLTLILYFYCLFVGLYFMACVAVERYLLVSHPIWYKTHHSLKVCCVVSVIIWFVPLILRVILFLLGFAFLDVLILGLIPYLIVILSFVGTCRGLSHAISLTPLKRKLILGSLFLVLLTYTFLILPYVLILYISSIVHHNFVVWKVYKFSECLLYLNPLADCILYLFMRPDAGGLLKSVHCCCRTDRHPTHSRDEPSRDSSGTFACCVSAQKPASHSRTTCSSVPTAEIELR